MLLGLAVVAAVVLRWWIFVSPLGRIESDEGVIGLMALAMRDGSRAYIAYGESYGGSLQPALAALGFHVFGFSTQLLKLASTAFVCVSAVLVWRIARYVFDERRARFAGALFLVYPAFDVWWSTKAGYYTSAVACSLAVVLWALRVNAQAERGSIRGIDVAALGFFTGLAWWTTPQCGFVVVPILTWLVVGRWRSWRASWPFVPAALLGAAPWVRWNLANDWSSLRAPRVTLASTYADRFRGFFIDTLPQTLGFRMPYERSWILWGAGRVLYSVVLLLGVWAAVRIVREAGARRRYAPLFVIVAMYPFVYAVFWTSIYETAPRYLTQLAPFAAIAVAAACSTLPRQLLVLGVAIALAAGTIVSVEVSGGEGGNDIVGPKLGELEAFLDRRDIDFVYADYWIAYALTVDTEKQVLATPVDFVREPTIDVTVAAVYPSTYVLFRDSARDQAASATLAQLGVGFRRHEVDNYAVFVLDRTMKPDAFPPGFWAGY